VGVLCVDYCLVRWSELVNVLLTNTQVNIRAETWKLQFNTLIVDVII
jgi:hypothetical protein